jgi:hypothetical protein
MTGDTVRVPPGGIIGRLETAALRLNDPRMSEAHAMVSLRQGGLWLLALRGRLMNGGKRVKEIELVPGVSIAHGAWHALEVLDVRLPATVPGLESEGIERLVPPPVVSFTVGTASFVAGFVPDADAVLWTHGGRFFLERGNGERQELLAGQYFSAAGRSWRVIDVPTSELAATRTGQGSRHWSPVRVLLRNGHVHIITRGTPTAIDGTPATILHALARRPGRHPWHTIARVAWPGEIDESRLRVLWDGALARLRKKLASADIRTNLVRMDGVGHVELFLGPDDSLESSG